MVPTATATVIRRDTEITHSYVCLNTFIYSIYDTFGSGVTVPGYGFVLNDPAALRAGGLLVAPNGPLTLEGVSVVTHQFSLSLPLH